MTTPHTMQCWVCGGRYLPDKIKSLRIGPFDQPWHRVDLGVTICASCAGEVRRHLDALQCLAMVGSGDFDRE